MDFLRKSGLYLCGRVVPALVGVGAVAIYTRLLPPAVVGTYALLLSISLLTSAIGFSWLRIASLRVASAGEEFEPDFTATVALLFVATAAIVALIEGIALHLYQPGYSPLLLVLAVASAIAAAWNDLNASLLQARLNIAGWGALNLSRAVVALGSSVALIAAGWKTEALLAGFVIGNLSTLAFARLWRSATLGRFDTALFWRCFHFGWPQSVNAAQGLVAPAFARWLLTLIAGSSTVGIFAVAQDFSTQTIASLVGAVSLAGIPLAFKAHERGDALALARQLRSNAQLIFGIALPATVGFALLAEPIAHTFFGQRFWNGAPLILTLVGLSAFAINLRVYYFDQAFELVMETRPQAVISMTGTIVAVVATCVFVPPFGAAGAAAAALLGSIICLALSIVWGARVLRMPVPIDDWLRTASATAGMALFLELVPKDVRAAGFALAMVGGTIVYVALSLATRFSHIRTHIGARFAWLQRS